MSATTITGRWRKLVTVCGGVAKLAKKLECSPTDIYRWSHGWHVPVVEMQIKIRRVSARYEIACPAFRRVA